MRISLAAALIFAGAANTRAQSVEHETLTILGWNNACSVAFTHYGWAAAGSRYADEPLQVRIGTLTIPPGSQKEKPEWLLSQSGGYAFNELQVNAALEKLKKAGYDKPGFVETIRSEKAGPQPGLDQLLRSTAALTATAAKGWPDSDYEVSEIRYAPLPSCALVTYRFKGSAREFFFYTLTRVSSPAARQARARYHVENALLLLDAGDLQGALAETTSASSMAPESALARYHHAAALCMDGSLEESLAELAQAVGLDKAFADKARGDINFETLRRDGRFKELTKPIKVKKAYPKSADSPLTGHSY